MKCLRVGLIICIGLFTALSVFSTDHSFKLDFDGDGRTDIALYREGSRDVTVAPQPSYWFFLNTNTGQTGVVQWGRTLDVPAPADFDADGKTDMGIYRWWDFETGDTNQWWLSQSSSGGHQVLLYEPGYNKFNRNYMGDARAEIGQLYQVNTSQDPGNPCQIAVYFVGDLEGNTLRKTVGDACNVIPTPVPGDYDNDGRSEIAVFNNGVFKVWFPPYDTGDTQPSIVQPLDVDSPVPGDYDGDGKTDIAVYRPAEGSWWILNSSNGSLGLWFYGLPTDTPLAMPVIPFDPS